MKEGNKLHRTENFSISYQVISAAIAFPLCDCVHLISGHLYKFMITNLYFSYHSLIFVCIHLPSHLQFRLVAHDL